MYAVVSTGGKQLKVEEGTEAVVEKLDAAVGDTVALDVLFVADGEQIVADADALQAAKVEVEVVEHFLGEKQVVFKFKRRKGYKRTKGHRQPQTRIKVTGIDAADAKKAAKKPAKKAKSAPKAEEKAQKAAPAAEDKAAKKAAPAPEAKAEEVKAEAPVEEKVEAPKAEEKKAEAAEEVKLCAATKANGDPCTNKAKEGSDYCGVHAKKYDK